MVLLESFSNERAETFLGVLVWAQGLLVGERGVVRDLLRDGAHLFGDRLVVSGILEQNVDPALRTVVRREIVVEQELPQHEADSDIGERAKREDAPWRTDQTLDLRVLLLDLLDDRADRLVDQREPDLLELGHARSLRVIVCRRILGRVPGPDLLEELARRPERTALLLDVDGVLAPIVERPEDARVPKETRAELARLAARYALVAAISGRASDEARRIVGVRRLVYVGSHGLELSPDAERWRVALQIFLASVEWPVENKGLTASFHYRTTPDEASAKAALDIVAARAEQAGLRARFGRKVLEILPPIEADKGTAIRQLLSERDLTRALYAGDDTTDLDAFAVLDGLELGVRVAVSSAEGPPELRDRADLIVDGPSAFLELLRSL